LPRYCRHAADYADAAIFAGCRYCYYAVPAAAAAATDSCWFFTPLLMLLRHAAATAVSAAAALPSRCHIRRQLPLAACQRHEDAAGCCCRR